MLVVALLIIAGENTEFMCCFSGENTQTNRQKTVKTPYINYRTSKQDVNQLFANIGRPQQCSNITTLQSAGLQDLFYAVFIERL